MATLPSTLPTANPLFGDAVKHEITRVCHLRGDVIVCAMVNKKKEVNKYWCHSLCKHYWGWLNWISGCVVPPFRQPWEDIGHRRYNSVRGVGRLLLAWASAGPSTIQQNFGRVVKAKAWNTPWWFYPSCQLRVSQLERRSTWLPW